MPTAYAAPLLEKLRSEVLRVRARVRVRVRSKSTCLTLTLTLTYHLLQRSTPCQVGALLTMLLYLLPTTYLRGPHRVRWAPYLLCCLLLTTYHLLEVHTVLRWVRQITQDLTLTLTLTLILGGCGR